MAKARTAALGFDDASGLRSLNLVESRSAAKAAPLKTAAGITKSKQDPTHEVHD